jgi:hypothetical protein
VPPVSRVKSPGHLLRHADAITITPEKCIVPVHLLTRGFNADWTRQRAGPGQAPLSSGGRTV